MKDQKARLIGIPLTGLIISLFVSDFKGISTLTSGLFWFCVLTGTIFTAVFWYGIRVIIIHTRRRFSEYSQTYQRILALVGLSIAYVAVVSFLITYLLTQLGLKEAVTLSAWFGVFSKSLIPGVIITCLYECVYFFEQWKKNIQHNEALARENIISQFEALKNQVDPHFLFNCLNTLGALIDEENELAQTYLEQLSDVYRYVLLSKDKTTATLEDELGFMDSYLYLCKMRFRENIRIENTLSPEYYRCHLPALSLQLLVENAIKHNIVSKEKPLSIQIFHENDCITVKNNIQQKTVVEKSTKVGLQNIINRYSFLTTRPIEIDHNQQFFTVRLPLLPVIEI